MLLCYLLCLFFTIQRLLTARQKQMCIDLRDERRQAQRHEILSFEPSVECLTETIQNDDTQSKDPVTLRNSASDIHQTSTSATTSLLLNKSSTTVSTPKMKTATLSWFARLLSHVLAVVKSGFSFMSLEQGILDNTKSPEGSVQAKNILRTDNASDLAVSGNGSLDVQLQEQPEFSTEIVTRQKALRLALRDTKQVQRRRWINRDIYVDRSTLDKEQQKLFQGLTAWIERGHENSPRSRHIAEWFS